VKVEVIKPEPRGAASPGVKWEMEHGSASTPGSSTAKAEPVQVLPPANADETDGASTGKSEWLLIKRRTRMPYRWRRLRTLVVVHDRN